MTEDEMVGCHHQLDGHEFDQAPGVGDGQESLACCSPWGHKTSDTTEQLNRTDVLEMNSPFKNSSPSQQVFFLSYSTASCTLIREKP